MAPLRLRAAPLVALIVAPQAELNAFAAAESATDVLVLLGTKGVLGRAF